MSELESQRFWEDRYQDAGFARQYAATGGPFRGEKEEGYRAAVAVANALATSGSLLELGAGCGHYSRLLAHGTNLRILATEGSAEMLRLFPQELLDHEQVTTMQLDFEGTWPPSLSGHDLVTSAFAFQYSAQKPRLLSQIYQALRPGGHVLILDHIRTDESHEEALIGRVREHILQMDRGSGSRRLVEQILEEARQRKHQATETEYERAICNAGFVDFSCFWKRLWLAAFVARRPAVGPSGS